MLEAAIGLERPAAAVCLTAAAVDDDVLTRQYAAAAAKAGRIGVLASRKDKVLKLAYPAGDFVSDIFYDSDSPFRSALGLRGARPTRPADYCIPGQLGYDHGDYFPAERSAIKWEPVADHIRRLIVDESQIWPPTGVPWEP